MGRDALHKELKKDGTKADPIRIVAANGTPWDGSLIGNGTVVDVKFIVKEYPGKKSGVYIRAVRVLELVKYEAQDFAPLDEDDKFFAEQPEEDGTFARLPDAMEPDLNDDVPM
jgi:hypothetical protein